MSAWPSKFKPLYGSYRESPPDNSIRSTMDRGPAKVRRRTTTNVRPISFDIFVKSEDIDEFDEFYTTDTFSGADEFDFTHPRTKQAVKARFVEPPAYTDSENAGYQVSVKLEILP